MHYYLPLSRKIEECKALLRSTNRPNVDKLISYISELGYFIAPGSFKHHRFQGGLVSHSLETYKMAMDLRQEKINQGISQDLIPVESVIIAALMHDLCKADELLFNTEQKVVYSVKQIYVGHSRKSVAQVGKSGFRLTEQEKDAILWHMGGNRFYEDRTTHFQKNPLSEIIYNADKRSIKEAKRRHHLNRDKNK